MECHTFKAEQDGLLPWGRGIPGRLQGLVCFGQILIPGRLPRCVHYSAQSPESLQCLP
jgi:hypothetical protein